MPPTTGSKFRYLFKRMQKLDKNEGYLAGHQGLQSCDRSIHRPCPRRVPIEEKAVHSDGPGTSGTATVLPCCEMLPGIEPGP